MPDDVRKTPEFKSAYVVGHQDYAARKAFAENPHDPLCEPAAHYGWLNGWSDADDDARYDHEGDYAETLANGRP